MKPVASVFQGIYYGLTWSLLQRLFDRPISDDVIGGIILGVLMACMWAVMGHFGLYRPAPMSTRAAMVMVGVICLIGVALDNALFLRALYRGTSNDVHFSLIWFALWLACFACLITLRLRRQRQALADGLNT